jgi:hypothetical protein
MYVMYYALILQCWQLIMILVKTNHPYLRVGCHIGIVNVGEDLVGTSLQVLEFNR